MTSFPSHLGHCMKDPLQFHPTQRPAQLRCLERGYQCQPCSGSNCSSQWPALQRTSAAFTAQDFHNLCRCWRPPAFVIEDLVVDSSRLLCRGPQQLSLPGKPVVSESTADPLHILLLEFSSPQIFLFTEASCLSLSLPGLLYPSQSLGSPGSQHQPLQLCTCKTPAIGSMATLFNSTSVCSQ